MASSSTSRGIITVGHDRSLERVFGICLAVSLTVALVVFSNVGGGGSNALFVLGLLALLGLSWLGLLVRAILKRRRPAVAVAIAPLLVVALAAPTLSGATRAARWSLSEPAFDRFVARIGPPTAQPPYDEASGWPEVTDCPRVIGLYVVERCDSIPGGYLFTIAGQDGPVFQLAAGFAYLPDGFPPDGGTTWMEGPNFVPLNGHWYAFTSTW